jgi:hypothetical protein
LHSRIARANHVNVVEAIVEMRDRCDRINVVGVKFSVVNHH